MSKAPYDPVTDQYVIELRRIGNSIGFILSKDVLSEFGLKQGDRFMVLRQPGGDIKLRPYEENHAHAMAIARKVMLEYSDTFKALAQSEADDLDRQSE